MYIKEKKQNHFLNLMNDPTLAVVYFHNKDMDEFNNQRLMELQNSYKNAKTKYNQKLSLLSIASFLGLENKTYNLSLKVEQEHKKMINSLREIDIFESNLAYLLICGIISFENCKQLGFDGDYVRNMLEQYKKQAENPYVEYYCDEKTGTTSVQTENGEILILPYTPHEVSNKIKEKRAKVPATSYKIMPRKTSY